MQQPDYPSEFVKYKAGLSSGDLPDLAQFEDTTVQQLVDSQSTVPVQDCIAASHYSLSDYLARALAFYRYHGVQQSMPWSVSNVIMYYNPVAFQKAGLNPNTPPQTFAQVTAASKKIVAAHAATHGVALPAKPYVFEFLLAKSGGQYVNNGNGRMARATAADLTSPTSLKVWRWWNQMLTSHLALATGSDPNNIDHLIAIATGNAAMTFEASGIIGPAEAVLASGQYPGVQIRTAPLPALTTGGGVPVGDGSLWISAHATLAKRAAAWQLIQYLDSPAEQASLAAESGYVPIRVSATKFPVLATKWANDPNYKVGYTQLTSGTLELLQHRLAHRRLPGRAQRRGGRARADGHQRDVAAGSRRLRRERGQHRHPELQQPHRRRLTPPHRVRSTGPAVYPAANVVRPPNRPRVGRTAAGRRGTRTVRRPSAANRR